MSRNVRLPLVVIPAVPVPSRSVVKHTLALSPATDDLIVVPVKFIRMDVSPDVTIHNVCGDDPFRCVAPTVTVAHRELSIPQYCSSDPPDPT
jgi:hypothetical protein